MPTEEVFTSPHRLRADGTVRATMPFALRGGIVEGLELRLSGGEIVEVTRDARRGPRPRRDRARRRRAPSGRARARRRVVARRRDRPRVPQHAVRRERGLAHRVGRGARVDGRGRRRRGSRGRRAQRLPDAHRLHDRLARGRGRRRRGGRRHGPAPARRASGSSPPESRPRVRVITGPRGGPVAVIRLQNALREPASIFRSDSPMSGPALGPHHPHGVWLRAEGVRAGGLRPGTASDGGMGIGLHEHRAAHDRRRRGRGGIFLAGGAAAAHAAIDCPASVVCRAEPFFRGRRRGTRRLSTLGSTGAPDDDLFSRARRPRRAPTRRRRRRGGGEGPRRARS